MVGPSLLEIHNEFAVEVQRATLVWINMLRKLELISAQTYGTFNDVALLILLLKEYSNGANQE